MKKTVLLLGALILMLFACQSDKKDKKESIVIGTKQQKKSSEYLLGEKLFKGKGNCYSCHRFDKKSIGPSIKKIMKIYKEKDGDLIGFLKQKSSPIVEPENYAIMKTNFVILERFTSKELKALETYMNDIIKE